MLIDSLPAISGQVSAGPGCRFWQPANESHEDYTMKNLIVAMMEIVVLGALLYFGASLLWDTIVRNF